VSKHYKVAKIHGTSPKKPVIIQFARVVERGGLPTLRVYLMPISAMKSGAVTPSVKSIRGDLRAKHNPALRLIGVSNPSEADVHMAETLDAVGLPLGRVIDSTVIDSMVLAQTTRGNPDLTISREKASILRDVYAALRTMLGDSASPSQGEVNQRVIKDKIQKMIAVYYEGSGAGAPEGRHAGESVAKWIRYLAVAKRAGLWPSIIDPGQRVVYRGLEGVTSWPVSARLNEQSRAQAEAMIAAGISTHAALFPGGKLNGFAATRAWLRAQSEGAKGFILDPKTKLWTAVPGNTLRVPDAMKKDVKPSSGWGVEEYGIEGARPVWANELWANVAGFWIMWAEYRFDGNSYDGKNYSPGGTPKMIGHWSALRTFSGFGSGSFRLRARTNWNDGFVLLPAGTLTGAGTGSHLAEKEIVLVETEHETPAEIILESMSGGESRLTSQQIDAYHAARPSYPVGYVDAAKRRLRDAGVEVKANPAPSAHSVLVPVYDPLLPAPRFATPSGQQYVGPRIEIMPGTPRGPVVPRGTNGMYVNPASNAIPNVPDPATIHSLLFARGRFGRRSALEWARGHGIAPIGEQDSARDYKLYIGRSTTFRKGSYRTVEIESGVRALVGERV
jgi:hypothetical protein